MWNKRVDYRKVKKVKCLKDHTHRSQAEAQLCNHITAREKLGECQLIQIEATVHLTRARILYKPDFKIFDNKLQETVWEEMKGFKTQSWAMKRRLWKEGYGPGLLRVWYLGQSGIYLGEEIRPKNLKEE